MATVTSSKRQQTHTSNTYASNSSVTVGNGSLTLQGTGRIQGVDTVSATTDAANKAYVDAQVGAFDTLQEVTDNGNTTTNSIGIGTTSVGTINGVAFSSVGLHVKASTLGRTITEGSSWGEYIMNHSGASANQRGKFIQSKSGSFNLGSYDDNGTQRVQMTVLNSGNVGIGTTSVGTLHGAAYGTTKLHVDGGTDRGQMIIEGDSFAGIVLSDNGTTANTRVFATTVDEGKYSIKPLNDSGTSTAGGEAITVLHGGNVGIGTPSPSYKLQVRSVDANDDVAYIHHDNPSQTSGTVLKVRSDAGNSSGYSLLDVQNNSVNALYVRGDGKVGIGTTSPSEKLDVVGDVKIKGSADFYNTSDQLYGRVYSDSEGLTFDTVANRHTRFYKQGVETMRIDTSGNVGIGDTTPSYKLDVNGTLRATSAAYFNNDVVVTNNLTLTGANKPTFTTPDDTVYTPSHNWVTATPFNAAWHDLIAFDRNYTTSQEISTDGSTFSSDTLELGLFDQKDKANYTVIGSGERAVRWTWTGVAYNVARYFYIAATYSNPTPSCTVKIETSSDGSTWTEIHSSSGISFSASNRFYHVDPYVGNGGHNYVRLTIDKGNTDTKIVRLSGIKMLTQRLGDQGKGREDELPFYYDKNQNIGIGVATPTAKLHIDDNASTGTGLLVTGGGIGAPLAKFTRDVGGSGSIEINSSGSAPQIQFASYANTFALGTNASTFEICDNNVVGTNTRLSINSSGNVGIGTANPNVPLEVHGADITSSSNTTAESVLRLVRDITDSSYTSRKDSAVDFMLSRQQAVANNLPYTRLDIRLAGTTDSSTPSLDVMSLLYNGNVGIGTTNPSSKLHVAGQIMIGPSSGTPSLKFQDSGVTNAYIDLTDGQQRFDFRDDSDTVMSVTLDTLRVGIGTASPLEKLHVNGGNINIQNVASSSPFVASGKLRFLGKYDRYLGGINTVNTGSYAEYDNGLDFYVQRDTFNAAGHFAMRITHSGNVGIGTTSPYSALQVGDTEQVSPAELTIASRYDGGGPILNFRSGHPTSGNNSVWNMARIVSRDDGNYNGRLEFRTTASGGHTGTQPAIRMVIKATGNVGIGTNGPNSLLHVNGEAQFGATSYQGDMNGGKADLSVDCGGTSQVSWVGDYFQVGGTDLNYNMRATAGLIDTWSQDLTIRAGNTGTTSKLHLGTNGQTSTIVCNNGNVGIGTASPEVKLHVGTSTLGTAPDTNADIISSGGITIDDNRRLSFDTNYYIHGNIRYATSGTTEAKLEYQGYYGHNFITRSSSRMVISGNTGNVGIGQITPSEKLEVIGHIKQKQGSGYTNYVLSSVNEAQLTLSTYTGNQSNNPSAIIFSPNLSEAMRIDNAGNVGIGTVSPNGLLEVRKDQTATTRLIISNGGTINASTSARLSFYEGAAEKNYIERRRNGSGDFAFVSPADDNPFVFENATGEFMTLVNSKVGIGTNNPANKIDVNGVGSFVGGTVAGVIDTQSAGIYLSTTGRGLHANFSGYSRNLINHVTGGIIEIGQSTSLINQIKINAGSSGTNGIVTLLTKGAERMRIAADGNVGIGTTSPRSSLDIGDSDLYIGNHPTTRKIYFGGTANYFTRGAIHTTQTNLGLYNDYATGYITLNTNSGEAVRVDEEGNVGIGTTDPSHRLEIRSTTATHELVSINRPNSNTAALYIGNDSSSPANGVIASNYSDLILGRDQSGTLTEHVRIKRDGNVGIGTTNPSQKLDVNGNVNISNGGILFQQAYGINLGVSGYDIVMPTATRIAIKTSATERLTILNNGNVGIGTTSPASELDVNGVTTSKGFRTNTSNTNYNLITRNSTSTTLYVQAAQSNSTQTIASFRYGSATANAGTETFRIRRDNINVFGANFTVDGSITGNSKNFSIKHPTKEGKRLVHSCLEGPEVGVYFRGRSQSSTIEMPDYWGGLVHLDSMTVELTAIGPNQDLYVEDIADDGEITVGSNTETPLNYFYVVYGERKDIGKLDIEVIDAEYSG